ncbi:hypothetical protein J4E83_002910 [Alternaria metachromatica]|uniref:uncharacterized protein n=1 Tax=Alternaria metachromatica TaxID=283354 RepID=UPI0020C1E0DA|nr:uncharacterized protein J4E83_002910 [Alternaria metachromatica]KAI4631379.1 hypothetical protein J4E83_002910 [Alternaria metachromatica]
MADNPEAVYHWVMFYGSKNDGEEPNSNYGAAFGGMFGNSNSELESLEQTLRAFCEEKGLSPKTEIADFVDEVLIPCNPGNKSYLDDVEDKPLLEVLKLAHSWVADVLEQQTSDKLYMVRTIKFDKDGTEPQERHEPRKFPTRTSKRLKLVAPRITPGDTLFDLGWRLGTRVYPEEINKYIQGERKRLKSYDQKELCNQDELWLLAFVKGKILKRIIVMTEWSRDKSTSKWIQTDITEIINGHIDEDIARNGPDDESSEESSSGELLPEEPSLKDLSLEDSSLKDLSREDSSREDSSPRN